MRAAEFIKHYLVSPLGISCLLGSAAAGTYAGIKLGPLVGVIVGCGAFLGMLALAVISGAGSKAAVRERDRRTWADAKASLEAVRKAQARLGSMRIPDGSVKRLAETAALRGGEYYAACMKHGTHDPKASFAIGECIELLDVYLTELDESSTEKRFALPDANPFSDAADRVRASLEDRIAVIAKATLDIQGGLSAKDHLEIKEQL